MNRNLTTVGVKNVSLQEKFAALAVEYQATPQELEVVDECVHYHHAHPRNVLRVAREVGIPVSKVAEIYEIRDYLPGERKASIIGVARLMRDFNCGSEEITDAIERALDFMSVVGRLRDVPRCIRLMRDVADEYEAVTLVDILDAIETALAAQ